MKCPVCDHEMKLDRQSVSINPNGKKKYDKKTYLCKKDDVWIVEEIPRKDNRLRIYVSHSSMLDYKQELYEPIKKSPLARKYEFIFPHETFARSLNSKHIIPTCDFVIAEVSYPSIGQGIELGWTNMYSIPIVALHKSGTKPSSSIQEVTQRILEYNNANEILQILERELNKKS